MSTELAELFERDALAYSEQDIEAIVRAMRELRAQFELGLKAPAAERPKKAPKKKGVELADVDLLKDLDLS